MTQPMRLENRVALLTGAASGISRATAVSRVRRGSHALVARLAWRL